MNWEKSAIQNFLNSKKLKMTGRLC